MRKKSKQLLTSVVACLMAVVMFVTPVFAASTVSLSYPKMNALNGLYVTKYATANVYGSDPSITQVKLSLTVSSGSDPFHITITSPEGTVYTFAPSTTSNTYTINYFNGENPNGKWYITLTNDGITYNPIQIYPTSTVTPRLTIYYN